MKHEQVEFLQDKMPERDLLLNWTGTECIDVMEALFETAVQLNEKDDRCTLLNMAMTLMECQNLMDWVEKTPDETAEQQISVG